MRERRPKARTGALRPRARDGKPATRRRDNAPLHGSTVVPRELSVPATEAKNRFGEVLKAVRAGEPVFIERHGRHQAVVLGVEAYRALVAKHRTPDEARLEALREEFDALYARMQTARSSAAIDELLEASDEEINRAVARRG